MELDDIIARAERRAEAIATGYPCGGCGAAWNTAGNELIHKGDCPHLRDLDFIEDFMQEPFGNDRD